MPILISYGTLQEEGVQLSTFGRRLQGQGDELLGFAQSSIEILDLQLVVTIGKTHHVNVTFDGSSESRVGGTAFEVMESELAAVDQYEQRAAYRRIAATLASGRRASLYVDACSVRGAP